jgi:hypothetical protein
VPAAILLEQAAISCFKIRPTPFRRKAAFYLCMAAHRYETTGFKALARRCLIRAVEIYSDTPPTDPEKPIDPLPEDLKAAWYMIMQHTHHGLGRQAYNLGHPAEATKEFLLLLEQSSRVQHAESMVDDQDVWDDFVNAYEVCWLREC